MKTNKLCFFLGALLLLTALAGCGKETGTDPIETTRSTKPLISTAAPTTPSATETTEPTGPTEPPPSLEPVTKLSAIEWQTIPQFLSLGDGRVLACRNDYEEGKGVINYLDVLDVYTNTVLTQRDNSSPRELVEQAFSDGHFVLRDPETSTLYIYDRTLHITDQITVPNAEGYFSQDRSHYFFVDNDVLYRMDVASGNYARMTLEYDLRLECLTGVHPDRNIVTARFYRSFYDESYGICAIDCNTGKFLILNENATELWLDGDAFYAAMTNSHLYGVDICYGTLDSSVLQKATSDALGSDTVSYTMLPGSGIMMLRTTSDDNLSTTVYDLSQNGICSKLEQYDYTTSTLGSVYLEQEQLIFGVYPLEEMFYPVVIDPKVLTYEKSLSINKEFWPALVDKSVILQYQKQVQGPQLPDSLSALRQQADDLEDKYGVTILMENQTLEFCLSYAAVQTDAALISNALTTLDQALALYPKGFLKQFQNGIGEGGLYFCLTGQIQGSLDPVGKTVKNRNRYELLLDIGADGLDRTPHHELWHAIEMKVSTDSFNHPQWHSLNPQGALYYGHYDNGYLTFTQWTYEQSGSQCCYVDAYARINSREDRARIMEYVMATDASDLMQSQTLQKKLQIMSKTIRDHFDTAGWQTPYWEQYI